MIRDVVHVGPSEVSVFGFVDEDETYATISIVDADEGTAASVNKVEPADIEQVIAMLERLQKWMSAHEEGRQ